MATGDITFFNQFYLDEMRGEHNLETDTIRAALVDNTIVPTAATADPRWGAGGTTNLAANEVSGTGYTAGGEDVAATTGPVGASVPFDGATNPSWSQNGAGPTDIYWGIIYNDTNAGKRAIGFVEMGGPVSLVDGDVSITWNAAGIATKAAV